MELFSTIPVTSCSRERAFSKLKIVESKCRISLNQRSSWQLTWVLSQNNYYLNWVPKRKNCAIPKNVLVQYTILYVQFYIIAVL